MELLSWERERQEVIFFQIRAGGDRNLGYLVGDEDSGEVVVVDPSYAPRVLLTFAEEHGLDVKWVIGTHAHTDHTRGMRTISRVTGAPTVKHMSARGARPDFVVGDLDFIPVGSLRLQVIHTPGHTPCSMCLLFTTPRAFSSKLLTGDTLFVGRVGGTRTLNMARKQYDSLSRIVTLGDSIEIWPGHDLGESSFSTIGKEKETNPFLKCSSFTEFLYLKEHWEEYKRARGEAM